MAEGSGFQESNLSEEQLDEILSSDSEDISTDDLLSSESTKTQISGQQDSSVDQFSNLLSDLGADGSQDSAFQDITNLGTSKITSSSSSEIQKAGIPLKELYDINVKFTVELGRTFMFIKDILLLGEGSIVELDKNVGDEVDILINDKLFARGKLVLVDEFYGVQITQILHPAYFKNI